MVFLNNGVLVSLGRDKLQTPSGLVVELEYRSLQPGETILALIKEGLAVKSAEIRFLGRKYTFGKGSSRSDLLALVGLDLALKPATYSMEIIVEKYSGEREKIEKEVPVSAKKFLTKELWVNEKFVTPPPEMRERIQREAQLLKVVHEVRTPQWLGDGPFILPSAGKIMPNFGERRIFNKKPRSSHGGVDIRAPFGSPVKASNSGRVVLANNLYFAGKTVIVDHGLGLFTLYCHFSKIRVRRGDLIGKGKIIGEVGATGRVTGPHLHWGTKVCGSRVDPFSLLSLPLDK